MEYPILQSLLITLTLILIISVIFRYLHLPIIFGYLVVGTLTGPHMFGWITEIESAQILAGFGVVFLMFTVGLEFSLPKMIALRKEVFLLGGLQVGITITLTLLICALSKVSLVVGLIIAGSLTMSSTAIVAKQLTDQSEGYDRHGKNAIGILLFQDFAVIPLLILITSLANNQPGMVGALLWAIVKGIIAIMAIIFIGQWLFKYIFHIIAATHLIELFTLAALLIVLSTAWLTYKLGLSFALGAFTAGMLLGTTSFRHQIAAEIRPFRDVLLGLFFITNGALLNTSTWHDTWPWITLLLIIILVGKSTLIGLLCYLFSRDKISSFRTGLVLAQGGEFSFAILVVAFHNNLISIHDGQIILSALLLSIAIAPILITHNGQIARWLIPKKNRHSPEQEQQSLNDQTEHLKDHVIICGYGTVGQNIANLLEEKNITYISMDVDPDRIHEASLIGKPVFYGDSTHIELLTAAGLMHAKAIVISFDDTASAKKILDQVHDYKPLLPTLVRCKNDIELTQLRDAGATQLIVESHEASLMITYCLLLALDFKRDEASLFIRDVREKHYSLLQQVFIDSYSAESSEEVMYMKQLESFILLDKADAINRSLNSINLGKINITVVALRRNKNYYHNPGGSIKLHVNDVLLLYGTREDLDRAEEILLKPKKSRLLQIITS